MTDGRGLGPAGGVLTATAVICAAFAFVGLDASSYSIDELFAVFAVDHDGGLGETLRRVLTDTHPPFYYFALHGWARLFGTGEAPLRLLSAICATAALPVLFLGLKGSFSLQARAFAVALGAGSKLFFEEAQEVRNYGVGLLLAAALLVLAVNMWRRLARGQHVGVGWFAALAGVGLAAAMTHFYLLLAAGALHLALLLAARDARARMLVVASGLAILGPVALYVVALLRASKQNIQNMWFSNAPLDLADQALGGVTQAWTAGGLVAVTLLTIALVMHRPWRNAAPLGPSAGLLGVCVLTIGAVIAAGLVVSFTIAPSFGRKNLILLGPVFWMLGAWLWDAVAAQAQPGAARLLTVAVVILACSNVATVRTRPLARNEAWRESAAYVGAVPSCQGAPMPVVLPFVFGPSTPFFRELARTYFFGRYDRWPARLRVLTPAEFAPASASPALRGLLRARMAGGCPILAWGVHDVDPKIAEALRDEIAATAGVTPAQVRIRTFARQKVGLLGTSRPKSSAYVFERVG